MTTFAQARESIYQRWVDNWTATPANDWTFAGEEYTPPEDRPWARLSVRHQAIGGQTLGPANGRRFTRIASVFVQLYIPTNAGEGGLDTLMQAATDLFEGVSFDGLRFFQADPRETGPEEQWQTALVEAPFDYDETK
jgi:hypothetical protein